jgi:hypothetical protein
MWYDRTGEVWIQPHPEYGIILIINSRQIGISGAFSNPVVKHERILLTTGRRLEFTETRCEWPMEKWSGFIKLF